jgi:hypothetical protein
MISKVFGAVVAALAVGGVGTGRWWRSIDLDRLALCPIDTKTHGRLTREDEAHEYRQMIATAGTAGPLWARIGCCDDSNSDQP